MTGFLSATNATYDLGRLTVERLLEVAERMPKLSPLPIVVGPEEPTAQQRLEQDFARSFGCRVVQTALVDCNYCLPAAALDVGILDPRAFRRESVAK